jgi:hypothetical protein
MSRVSAERKRKKKEKEEKMMIKAESVCLITFSPRNILCNILFFFTVVGHLIDTNTVGSSGRCKSEVSFVNEIKNRPFVSIGRNELLEQLRRREMRANCFDFAISDNQSINHAHRHTYLAPVSIVRGEQLCGAHNEKQTLGARNGHVQALRACHKAESEDQATKMERKKGRGRKSVRSR